MMGFVETEKLVANRGGSPLLNLAVFVPGVKSGLSVVFLGFVAHGGLLFTVAIYAQFGLGFSPMQSGLLFACYAVGFGSGNLCWSKLPSAVLRWAPPAALLLMALASASLVATSYLWGWVAALFIPLLFLAGLGHGISYGPTVSQMVARVPSQHAAAFSGLVVTSTQLAITLGIAGLGSLYLENAVLPHASMAIVGGCVTAIIVIAVLASLSAARSTPSKA